MSVMKNYGNCDTEPTWTLIRPRSPPPTPIFWIQLKYPIYQCATEAQPSLIPAFVSFTHDSFPMNPPTHLTVNFILTDEPINPSNKLTNGNFIYSLLCYKLRSVEWFILIISGLKSLLFVIRFEAWKGFSTGSRTRWKLFENWWNEIG